MEPTGRLPDETMRTRERQNKPTSGWRCLAAMVRLDDLSGIMVVPTDRSSCPLAAVPPQLYSGLCSSDLGEIQPRISGWVS
jgi:hypothetical protein